ncbi:MAG TPA: FMN-binding negative transcriptional regulator [Candidatus Binataceae bacterium]|nr:FMN-binding negative transcriptional regulator [Candidatus Binataceae bacterium]
MYVPKAFEMSELAALHDFIERYSFATLVSDLDGQPFATHLPLVLDRGGRFGALLGHVARANPHWRASGGESLAIFLGPHSYVSPSWYATSPAVPTWNYAAVHVYGRLRVIDDVAWVSGLLDRLIAIYESSTPSPWSGVLPSEFKSRLIGAIVGFRIEIDRIEAKFKLGQNRSLDDQAGMLRNLEEQPGQQGRELAQFIRRQTVARDSREDRVRLAAR